MKELFILRGIPGSGKTTLAKFLQVLCAPDLDVVLCSADDFFVNEKGEYNYDISKIGKAHSECQAKCEHAMGTYADVVIVHNTSTTERELKPYLDLAKNTIIE